MQTVDQIVSALLVGFLAVEHIDFRHAVERRLNGNGRSGAARPQHGDLLSAHVDAVQHQVSHKRSAIGVIAQRAAVLDNHRVHRAHDFRHARNLVQVRNNGALVRRRHVVPQEAQRLHAAHRRFKVLGLHVEGDEREVVAHFFEHGIVNGRRAGVRNRRADKPYQPC